MKLSATLSAAEPFINKAKFGLAAFGATSHIAAATASGSGLSGRDIPMLSIHKDLVVNIASTYSKYLLRLKYLSTGYLSFKKIK